MSDKFRKVFPIAVIFSDGDQPPSSKLNALASQARNGLGIVERGIGDIWNQSGDSNLIPTGELFKNALYINNLGRALGPQSFIAPRIHSLPGIEKYFDTIVTPGGVARPENWLKYKPVPAGVSLVSGDFTVGTVNPVGALTTYVTAPDLVDAAGKWHVTANGKLITFTPILSAELTYKPAPVPDVDDVAQSTVIPDPFTDTGLGSQFMGIKVSYANDTDNTSGFWIYLPPRRPLLASRKIAQSPNHSGNEVDPTGPDRYFFQGTGFDAASDAHYRYKFPKEIQDIIDLGATASLPDNFMYLVDTSTGTIIEGIAFSVDPTAPAYVVKATGSALNDIVAADLTLVTLKADQTSSAYKSRFKIQFPGNSLARAYAGLSKLYFNHSHIGADGSLPLSHSQLLDLYNSNSPDWEPSGLKGDDHPQYLHRDGMNSTRDNLKNGLRGDLLLLANNNSIGLTADSYRIRFGSDTSPSLYYDQTNDIVALDGKNLRVVTGLIRLNDMRLERTSAGRVVLHNGTAINDQELYAGKVTASSSASTTPGGVEMSMNADGSGGGATLSSNSTLHLNAPAHMVDNAAPFYFPSGTTQTDVFLNRDRVNKLWKALNSQKVWQNTTTGIISNLSGTTVTNLQVATVAPVIPTDLQGYLQITGVFRLDSNDNNSLDFNLQIRLNGVLVGPRAEAEVVADGSDPDKTTIVTTFGSSLLSAATHDVDLIVNVTASGGSTVEADYQAGLTAVFLPYAS